MQASHVGFDESQPLCEIAYGTLTCAMGGIGSREAGRLAAGFGVAQLNATDLGEALGQYALEEKRRLS